MAKESSSDAVWSIRGVSKDTKQLIESAAKAANSSIGSFANQALREAASRSLNIPVVPEEAAERTPKYDQSLVELASKIRHLEHRISKLELNLEGEPEDAPFTHDSQHNILDRLIQLAGRRSPELQKQLLGSLMGTLHEVNDPLLWQQMRPIIAQAKLASQ